MLLRRPQGAGGWPSGAQPPAASPAPPPQPPPPSAAASPSAAAAAVTAQHAQHAQQAQQQRYASDSYSAVPPPASLANPPLPAGGRRGFSIRPQLPKPKPPEPANPLVAAFQQAAAKLGGGGAAGAAAAGPAYTRVQVGAAAQQQAAAALSPQQWPPALKAYVERAFKASDLVSGARHPQQFVLLHPHNALLLHPHNALLLHPHIMPLFKRTSCHCSKKCVADASLPGVVVTPIRQAASFHR
jgi:hypothetical protein